MAEVTRNLADYCQGMTVWAHPNAQVNVITPSIAISKLPDQQTILRDSTANFTIHVSNTGDVTLAPVTVSDALAQTVGVAGTVEECVERLQQIAAERFIVPRFHEDLHVGRKLIAGQNSA